MKHCRQAISFVRHRFTTYHANAVVIQDAAVRSIHKYPSKTKSQARQNFGWKIAKKDAIQSQDRVKILIYFFGLIAL